MQKMDSNTKCTAQEDLAKVAARLEQVSLDNAANSELTAAVEKILKALEELFKATPRELIMEALSEGGQKEVTMWGCFVDAFEKEVSAQRKAAKGKEPSQGQKRQIMADILVWAEITQPAYDSSTAKFISGPNMDDASFRRVGGFLQDACTSQGVEFRRMSCDTASA